jgi:hypothetical protein
MKLKSILITIFSTLLIFGSVYTQVEGDVVINEIGNSGTKKKLYTGGDYVELLVVKDGGVKLAGWYLTDLSSPTGVPKAREGFIKFSDKENSVFNKVIPKGTYILVCLGDVDENYGTAAVKEDVSLDDGNNQVVVFGYHSPDHIEAVGDTVALVLTGKDGIALVSEWDKKKAVDVVAWGGKMSWTGAEVTELPLEYLDNGCIAYFKPAAGDFKNNTKVEEWITTANVQDATPGKVNKGVDDSTLKK